MKSSFGPGRQRGFTLIEVMTVVVVIGIFAAMAFPGFSYLTRSTRVKATATDVYLALVKARSEAVKRNASVTIAPTGGNWAAGWQIIDAANNVLVNQEALKGVTVAGPASVVYLSSGRIQGLSPQFNITYGQNSADKTLAIARCVSARANGSPYMKGDTC